LFFLKKFWVSKIVPVSKCNEKFSLTKGYLDAQGPSRTVVFKPACVTVGDTRNEEKRKGLARGRPCFYIHYGEEGLGRLSEVI